MNSNLFQLRKRMTPSVHGLPFVGAVALVLLLSLHATSTDAETLIVDQDFTIDASNSFPDTSGPFEFDELVIREGVSGAPTVRLVDGGLIGITLILQDESRLNMMGGMTEYQFWVTDEATLTYTGGSIACSALACLAADTIGVLSASGMAELHLFKNDVGGVLTLRELSKAHLYGKGLQIISDSQLISGARQLLVDGDFQVDNSSAPMEIHIFDSASIEIHEIPEPCGVVLSLLALVGTMLVGKRLPRSAF